jgi:hypothetical protein
MLSKGEGLSRAQETAVTDRESLNKEVTLASFRKDLEKVSDEGIPSLEDMESGKLVGAVLPMSEQAQMQMRNSIEVIDYLLNQERVVWS